MKISCINFVTIVFIFCSCSSKTDENINGFNFDPSKNTTGSKKYLDSTLGNNWAFSFVSGDTLYLRDTLRAKSFLANNTLKLSNNGKIEMSFIISNGEWYLADKSKWKPLKVLNDTGYLCLPLNTNIRIKDSIAELKFFTRITLPLKTGRDSTFISETPLVIKK